MSLQLKPLFVFAFVSLLLIGCGTDTNSLLGAWEFESKTLTDAASGNDIEENEKYVFSGTQMTLYKSCAVEGATTEVSVKADIVFSGDNQFEVTEGVTSQVTMSYQGNTYVCVAQIKEGRRVYIVNEDGSILIFNRDDSSDDGLSGSRPSN